MSVVCMQCYYFFSKRYLELGTGLKSVWYLLQKDGQLGSKLLLQLWVSSKQWIIHQNLGERGKKPGIKSFNNRLCWLYTNVNI